MSSTPPRVVIVAGMHRAGTSAVARSLAALGFDLGPRLMSADIRMNARGFFEDIDIVARNDALLALQGADWKSVALLDRVDWRVERFEQTRADARALLVSRLTAQATFAWKDPRVPRLLPFWQEILASEGVGEGYVIAVRHPRAVIASLTARDALDPRRSAWLWLTHLACALAYTQDRPRVIVDYDRLLAQPDHELARIARAFGVADADATNLREFRDGFLSADLRHAHFAPGDVAADEWPPLVAEAHALAQRLARDDIEIGSLQARDAIAALWAGVRAFAPLLDYTGSVEASADQVARLEGELAWAREALAAASRYNQDLVATIAQKDNDYAAERDAAQAAIATATTYSTSLREALTHVETELATTRRAVSRVASTRAGRALLRWLGRGRVN